MIVALDIHDFSLIHPRLEVILKLKNHFSDFKVSLFTIPLYEPCDYGAYLIRNETLKDIKKNLDWMQLIPHGLYHEYGREMLDLCYEDFKYKVVPQIENSFNNKGLPYEKGFCSPHWRQSEGVTRALDEFGWWSAVLREAESTPNRFYRYNYLLNEPFWESKEEVLKLHGHLYGTKNDIGLCMENLLKLPKDTKFEYVTKFIEIK